MDVELDKAGVVLVMVGRCWHYCRCRKKTGFIFGKWLAARLSRVTNKTRSGAYDDTCL